jgi:molybdopterin-containing oxidoreductase family iron-sulfur binding subunit
MKLPVVNKTTGLEYWRSLEQLAESPEARRLVEAEFPGYDPEAIRSLSRRRFMKLMGASMALAGLTLSGCRRWPAEKLAPYSSNPKERTPGVAEMYATMMEIGGVAHGLLVKSFDGRPIKVEGNPSHPFSRTVNPQIGAADALAQASVLELYDPERSRSPRALLEAPAGTYQDVPWERFEEFARGRLADGAGVAVLCEPSSGPSFTEMRRRFLAKFKQARWYTYEPVGRENEIAGAVMAFDQPVRARLMLDKASIVVSFDADLLGSHPAHLRYAADWSVRRRAADGHDSGGQMNRVYIAESCFSTTGAVADERLPARPSRMGVLVRALAQRLNVPGVNDNPALSDGETKFVSAAAADLEQARNTGVVAVGSHLSADVQAVVHAINVALGALGTTVLMLPEPKDESGTIKDLAAEMQAGRVKTLLVLGGNPAFDAPADLDFAKLMVGPNAPASIHLSPYFDETSARSTWHLPRAHYLEAWGDGRAYDGTVTLAQPLIEPLYGGKSVIELLAILAGEQVTDGQTIVRRTLAEAGLIQGKDDELSKSWRTALHEGLMENSGFKPAAPQLKPLSTAAPQPDVAADSLEVRFLADSKVYDGRFANNGWLQEAPDPLTKLTWDNAALISKWDADRLGIEHGDVVRVTVSGRSLEIAAYVLPGQPHGVIGLPLGYGRSAGLHVAQGVGFNTYALRTSDAMWTARCQDPRPTGRSYKFALTQDHHIIDEVGARGRSQRVGGEHESGKIIREATLSAYQKDPHFAAGEEPHGAIKLQLFNPPYTNEPAQAGAPEAFNHPHAWGMSIDMNACVGCNGCVVACQAENNVPIVGKDQVMMSREMHWIRIDRYFKGTDLANPEVVFQPMTCVHCENAPCEQVCPVAATVHDTEGLNTMVYNRCIGTRYCSNNCPYKVRRFNYFDWHSRDARGGQFQAPWLGMPDTQQVEMIDPIRQMQFNPDVTVRMRGVMEKCTYCVQRIHEVKIDKRNHGQEVKDGDVVTACQQACPTQAIVFGDLNDPNSRVRKLHEHQRAYGVLDEDLNTRPRTVHLAKISNPHGTT